MAAAIHRGHAGPRMWVIIGAELLDRNTCAAWFHPGCYYRTGSGAERYIKHSEVQQREHLPKQHQLGVYKSSAGLFSGRQQREAEPSVDREPLSSATSTTQMRANSLQKNNKNLRTRGMEAIADWSKGSKKKNTL